jgi:Zn-dependent protease
MTFDSIKLLEIGAAIAALLVAIIGHEIMHGWIAYKYGDMTAKNSGRLSINPIVHIDLFGSILVPLMTYFIPMLLGAASGFLFGWAKPVPVNMQTVIRNGGYNGAMQVALGGIAYNLFLAIIFSMILKGIFTPALEYDFLIVLLAQLVLVNTILAIFNLLPIPSFDGAHFLSYLSLKFKLYKIAYFLAKAEPYGMIIVIIILITPLKTFLVGLPINNTLDLLHINGEVYEILYRN